MSTPHLLCRKDSPTALPVIQSRHRTQHAAFLSVKGRKWDKLRKSGVTFFIPILGPGEQFKPQDWV